MCKLLKVSKATLYRHQKEGPLRISKEQSITGLVIKIFNENRQVFGWRNIKTGLWKKYQIVASRRLIRRIMIKNFLFSKYQLKQFKVHHKTKSDHIIVNILNRDFDNCKPLEFIVSGLTYVRVQNKWNYLCFITDLYNREIIGYSVGPRKDASLVYRTFLNIGRNLNHVKYFHVD